MSDDLVRREDSSDLPISTAHGTRRNQMYKLKQYAADTHECNESTGTWYGLYIWFLRAQCSENTFCLSSDGKDVSVSSSVFLISSICRRIWVQRLKLRLVSKFGSGLSSSENMLGVEAIFVHDCMCIRTKFVHLLDTADGIANDRKYRF